MNFGFYLSFFFLIMMFFFLFMLLGLNYMISVKIFSFHYFFLVMDWYSSLFFFILMSMVFSVLYFSSYYMSLEVNSYLFYLMYLSFVVSMVFLMFMPDFFFFFLGWDGLGLTSFFLIIYYQSSKSWFSGFKTFLMKRFGDGLLMVFFAYLLSEGYLCFFSFYDYIFVGLLSLLFLFGCFTKSCSYPFNSWLPVAMAAPTPVSALVHSSTLVTAGIYIIIRNLYFLIDYTSLLSVFGLFTLLIGSVSALFDWDMKKVMAYSTLSQLGLMFFMLGSLEFDLCFYHLMCHACFKALLFIMAGMLIYNKNHNQDLRYFSYYSDSQPVLMVSLKFCFLSLSGLFFFSGFYSKDSFLMKLGLDGKYIFNYMFMLFLGLTLVYSYRLLYWLVHKSINVSLFFYYFSSVSFEIYYLLFLTLYLGYLYNVYFFSYALVNFIVMKIYLLILFFFLFISFFSSSLFFIWGFYNSFYSKYINSYILTQFYWVSLSVSKVYESGFLSNFILYTNFNLKDYMDLLSFKYFFSWGLFLFFIFLFFLIV